MCACLNSPLRRVRPLFLFFFNPVLFDGNYALDRLSKGLDDLAHRRTGARSSCASASPPLWEECEDVECDKMCHVYYSMLFFWLQIVEPKFVSRLHALRGSG